MNRLNERLREINMLLSLGLETKDKNTANALKKERNEILTLLKQQGEV